MPSTHSVFHVLVIANETLTSQAVQDAIASHDDGTRFLLVAPALNTRIRHWTSDDDRARAAAAERLGCCIGTFDSRGLQIDGWVGDADPIQAVSDALAVFPADELMIATHPEHRSNWLARDLARRARLRFGLPVVHVVRPDQAGLALAAAA